MGEELYGQVFSLLSTPRVASDLEFLIDFFGLGMSKRGDMSVATPTL